MAIDFAQQLADMQAAMRALWPDRPKVYFQEGQGDDAPVLTDEERGQLNRVALAISVARESIREEMGAKMAEAEEAAVFDFLNWLAPQNIGLSRFVATGYVTEPEGELWERWKRERRD